MIENDHFSFELIKSNCDFNEEDSSIILLSESINQSNNSNEIIFPIDNRKRIYSEGDNNYSGNIFLKDITIKGYLNKNIEIILLINNKIIRIDYYKLLKIHLNLLLKLKTIIPYFNIFILNNEEQEIKNEVKNYILEINERKLFENFTFLLDTNEEYLENKNLLLKFLNNKVCKNNYNFKEINKIDKILISIGNLITNLNIKLNKNDNIKKYCQIINLENIKNSIKKNINNNENEIIEKNIIDLKLKIIKLKELRIFIFCNQIKKINDYDFRELINDIFK